MCLYTVVKTILNRNKINSMEIQLHFSVVMKHANIDAGMQHFPREKTENRKFQPLRNNSSTDHRSRNVLQPLLYSCVSPHGGNTVVTFFSVFDEKVSYVMYGQFSHNSNCKKNGSSNVVMSRYYGESDETVALCNLEQYFIARRISQEVVIRFQTVNTDWLG